MDNQIIKKYNYWQWRTLIILMIGYALFYFVRKNFSIVMPALESCLSVPGIYADVRRPESITVEYYDENFEKKTEHLDKFAARMVQHEMSHLDGVLFTDLLAPIRRKMIAKKLQNISHGKVGTHYNSKIK